MLNKTKLLKIFSNFSDSLFFDHSQEIELAQKLWKNICKDPNFLESIKGLNTPWLLPTWHNNLNDKFLINPINHYTIVSTDGSQIYPDRHQGTSCFLINIGTVLLQYGNSSNVTFDNYPFLFSAETESEAVEMVDCKRQEFEFKFGFELMQNQTDKNSTLFLFDGSLIFWHLESKSGNLLDEYLGKYLGYLHQFYKNDLLLAGYISLPKSKELVNLLRAKSLLMHQDVNQFDHLVDTQIASFYLDKFERTILFKNNSPIVSQYPKHLQPYFFYVDVGHEVVRIEVPEYIAQDNQKIDLICRILIDQCIKGHGYPVSLAEAHEQAVVKGPDREYFYQILYKISSDKKQKILQSRKSLRKSFMGV